MVHTQAGQQLNPQEEPRIREADLITRSTNEHYTDTWPILRIAGANEASSELWTFPLDHHHPESRVLSATPVFA